MCERTELPQQVHQIERGRGGLHRHRHQSTLRQPYPPRKGECHGEKGGVVKELRPTFVPAYGPVEEVIHHERAKDGPHQAARLGQPDELDVTVCKQGRPVTQGADWRYVTGKVGPHQHNSGGAVDQVEETRPHELRRIDVELSPSLGRHRGSALSRPCPDCV